MASAELNEVLRVNRDRLFNTITRYEDYPQFVDGCHRAEVERKAPGKARVTYTFSIIKDFTYILDLTEDREAGTVSWTLVESDFFKKNNGGWKIQAQGETATQVHYHLDVEFKVSVPGFILNKLVKANLPSMLKGFEKRAQS